MYVRTVKPQQYYKHCQHETSANTNSLCFPHLFPLIRLVSAKMAYSTYTKCVLLVGKLFNTRSTNYRCTRTYNVDSKF